MARVKRDLAILLVHLIATIAKLMGPGGVRSIEAIVDKYSFLAKSLGFEIKL